MIVQNDKNKRRNFFVLYSVMKSYCYESISIHMVLILIPKLNALSNIILLNLKFSDLSGNLDQKTNKQIWSLKQLRPITMKYGKSAKIGGGQGQVWP